MPEFVTCPSCDGLPEQPTLICGRTSSGSFSRMTTAKCRMCDGLGAVSPEAATRYSEGRKLRDDRVSRRVSQREEAQRLGIDVLELNRRERGY